MARLSDHDRANLTHHWRFWARPEQLPPEGDWSIWLVLAGRGFGKTRVGAEWCRSVVCGSTPLAKGNAGRIALVAETAADARDVMVEGESGILAVHPPDFRPVYEPSKRRLTWPNGAVGSLFNAIEPDQLRGPQHDVAWCFVAGTMVATPQGRRRIEDIRSGDLVETRKGPRRVVATRSRRSVVGRVTFGNGSVLVGTADHPVYLNSGWTRMDRLRVGDTACAIGASSGTASGGIATARAGAPTTSAPTSRSGQSARSGFTGRFGSFIEALCRRAMRSTIATAIWPTTASATSGAFGRASTPSCTERSSRSRRRIGAPCPKRTCGVPVVVAVCAAAGFLGRLCARRAAAAGPRTAERRRASALPAVRHSSAGVETTAVSVASTWRRMAERRVFCLTIEGEPEFFANGILVHNCDELAKWRYARETWDQLQFGLRLGQHPRQCVTTTPRPIEVLRELVGRATRGDGVALTRGKTRDNASNLAGPFLAEIMARYDGTRLGRQELDAEILDDAPGALWTRRMLDETRRNEAPAMRRTLVAIDPGIGDPGTDDVAETGIVAGGLGDDQRAYVLEDASFVSSPNEWARRAVSVHDRYEADGFVVEINQGGAMVANTIRSVRPNAKIIEVRATRGKHVRAEPVAALYEQGRVSHVGGFAALEDQMVMMTSAGFIGERSPDRLDALVWLLTELFPSVVKKVVPPRKAQPRTLAGAGSWMGVIACAALLAGAADG